jgi:hypothetical protein
MPAPTNIDAATATDLTGLLPYTLNQDVHFAGGTYTVWYKLTPDWTGVLGIWAHGDIVNPPVVYTPLTSIFDNNGLDIYAAIFNYPQRPIQIPVTSGHEIWFRFATNSITVTPALLEGTIQKFPAQSAPIGSILINDASSADYLTALVSPTTGAPLDYVFPLAGGEAMAQLTSGLMLLENIDANNLILYTGGFTQVATVTTEGNRISSNRSDLFYVGHGSSSSTPGLVQTVNEVGTIGATTWDVGPALSSLAPSRDDAILYYAQGAAADPIKRWDLATNLALSNLAAGVADHTVREIFVLADNTVLVLYRDTSPTSSCFVRHYSAAGATLLDYTTQFTDSTGTDPHIALANDDPDTFYAWFKIANGKSRFINIETSDGTINTTAEGWHFSSGLLDASVASGAPAYFGHSESCTFLITTIGITPPAVVTTEVVIPRRLRRAPHLSHEMGWAFHSLFQVDMETGVGLSDPDAQGHVPVIMIRWSDDGGHTWSNVHEIPIGKLGKYKTRALLRRLGRSRDRVYELTMSDPVRSNVIASYLVAEQGLS